MDGCGCGVGVRNDAGILPKIGWFRSKEENVVPYGMVGMVVPVWYHTIPISFEVLGANKGYV
jgi:hypothetical protein